MYILQEWREHGNNETSLCLQAPVPGQPFEKIFQAKFDMCFRVLLINSNHCYCDPWAGASINEYSPTFATFRGIMSGNQLAGAGKQSKTAIGSRCR